MSHELCSPLQAKEIGLSMGLTSCCCGELVQVVIEGEAKVYVDGMNGMRESIDQSISTIIYNSFELKTFFSLVVSLVGFQKKANSAAHVITKLAVMLKCRCCNKHEAPKVIQNACKVDRIIVRTSI